MRDDGGVSDQFLGLSVFIADTSNGAELAARQRRRHGDLFDSRRLDGLRRPKRAVRFDFWAHGVDTVRCVDVVRETQPHRLGAVGDGTSTDRHDQIGTGISRRFGGSDHVSPRGVRSHAVKCAYTEVAKCDADLVDLVGLVVQGVGDHE